MKKLNTTVIASLLMGGILIQGCSLDEVNTRIPVADTYYTTEEGAGDLVNSAYSYSQNIYEYFIWFMTEMGTDLWMSGGDGPKELNNYTFDASHWYVQEFWNYSYNGITACNTLLDRADNIQASEDVVNNYKGQALFLRAFYYHNLVMQFGDVPLVIKEVHTAETTATRAPESDVYAQIIADLIEAEKLLPIEATEFGRPTQSAAQALLARVYLWNEQWDNAATYAKKVISSGQHELLPDFADLWDANNQKNKEFIWTVQGSGNDTYNTKRSWASTIFTVRYDVHGADYGMIRDIANGRPYRYFMPTRHFFDLLASTMEWDNRFEKSFKWVWYVNDESHCTLNPGRVLGDTALYVPPFKVSPEQRAWAEGKYRIEDIDDYFNPESPNGEETSGPREMFPQMSKYLDPTRVDVGLMSSLDIPVIRLGEMYLIAAEALMNEGKAAEGVEFINDLRKRSAKSEEAYEAHKLDASELTIDIILNERAIELAGETTGRWMDLKRTGKFLEYIQLYNPDARNNIKEKHLYRPIPTSMLDRISNKDEFPQNPGY
ncbi:SusD-like protein [Bacteroides uniformis]|jgi:hypothetical protein|nr:MULTISPECIES: RagB/SusD family nutrient uptake outer membrane protein [Bacteroides]CAH2756427.1 SusD-like protein [Bacteroides uniformis]